MKDTHTLPTTPETPFLKDLFAEFNKCKIKYSVLRNYETLPNHTGGSDIDMVVGHKSWSTSHRLLYEIAEKNGGKCIAQLQACRVLDLAFCGKHNGQWWGVRFDTFTYIGTNGCDILPASDFLSHSFSHNHVCVAHKDDAALLSFLKEVIGAGKDTKKYRSEACKALLNNQAYYSRVLNDYFGQKTWEKDILPLIEGKNKNLTAAKSTLRQKGRMRFFRFHPIISLQRTVAERWYKLVRLIKTPGFAIAVLGTDGSGKSTIIERLTPLLEAALHNKIRYEHMRPNLLPSIARIFGRKNSSGPVKNPHASTPSGFAGSCLRLAYYSLDYILGYWLKVHKDKAKQTCLWIFDRYYYDYLIDPYRGRISLPRWVIKTVSLFIPKPNLILCLGADPAVIHQRKPELTLVEVERQVRELKKFCRETKRTVWIDTDCSIEQSVDQAMEAITSAMANRYKENG